MNYELAKQLKDAGFPQKGEWGYRPHDGGMFSILNYHRDVPLETDVMRPSLSELIDACGTDFSFLAYWEKGNEAGDWQASSDKKLETLWGSTPDEAVANLWLALSKR
jgi:hypothetical protein